MNDTLSVLTSSTGNKTDKWNTPQEVVNDVIAFFGGPVDLDPCSDTVFTPNVPCKLCYTEETNGLSHDWNAESVFVNHPYSDSKSWIPYAVSQYENGYAKEIVMLIKLDVSTRWFASISKYPWIAVNKRLRFGAATSAAPFQSAIFYLGTDVERFNKVFAKYGPLYCAA